MNASILDSVSTRDDPVAKKKTPRAIRTKVALFVEIKPTLREALDKAVEDERRGLNVVVSIALEKYLAELGYWPPADPPTK